MWPQRIVVITPLLDEDLYFLQAIEDVSVQSFIAQLAVDTLAISVFRGELGGACRVPALRGIDGKWAEG